jgi:autotransporter-associated beta strand protein
VGANWVGGNEPGSADTATINQNGAAVTINTTGNQVTTLNVMVNGGGNTSSLLIDTGGALTISGTGNNLWIAQQGNASPIGTLTVKGSLTYNGIVQMSTFQNAGTTPRSSLIISGGTVFIDSNLQMTAGGASTTASATFSLSNGGTISGLNNINTGNGTNTFNLTPISTGIDVVNTSGALTLGAGNNILNVDLSSYNVANGTTMTLFSYGSRSGSWGSVNINSVNLGTIALGTPSSTPFTAGYWQGDFVVTAGSIYLNNLVYNPNRWWDGTNTGGTGDGASDGGTATWDTSTLNWDQGNGYARVAWANGNNNTAIFAGTAGTVSLGTGITVGGLQFDTASYIIQNDTLTWGASGSIVANQNATISSIMAGSVAITKSGAGTLYLTAANTYSGGTIVSNGTLVLDKTGKDGITPNLAANSNLTITNATVSLAGGNTSNAIYNTSGGTITLSGGGTLVASQATFNAHNVYNVDMNGGLLTAGAGTLDGALANWYVNNTISNTVNSTISASLGRNANNGSLPVDVASGTTLLISGPIVNISGANGLTKSGSGTLSLSGTNTYTGTTTINGGTLEIGGAGLLGSGSYTAGIADSGLLFVNSTAAQTLGGIISGTGALVKASSGSLTLTAKSTHTGGTTVNGGTLILGAGGNVGTLRGALTVNAGGTVTSTVVNALGIGVPVSPLNINGGTLDLSFGQHHIWASTVNMVGGTLKFSSTIDNEQFNAVYNVSNSTSQAQILSPGGGAMRMRDSVVSPCMTFNVADGSQAVDLLVDVRIIVGTGAGGLTKNGAGTIEFTKANNYNGPTAINAGRVFVNGTGSGSSAHTVEIGATLAGTGTVPGATTVNGIIAPGSIASPTGTLNIANNVTWNGASDNAVTTRDWYFDLGPGNTSDTLNITGNFVKGSGDHFRFNFGGTTNQGTYKLVDWSGTTTFSESDFSYDASSLGNFQDVYFLISGSQLEVVLYGPCPTPPTVTLGTSPTVCRGTTTASLSYSNPQESPTLYYIDYDNTANTVGGFTDVNLTALGASPITLAVPVAAPVGTYNASLYLVNADGCRSLAIPFTVTVIDTPSTPGAISGSASVCHDTSGVIYSITAVSSASTYTWAVPGNGSIVSGQGTTSITVDWGAAGTGSITVHAQNSCGTSADRSLSVTVHAGEPDAPVANAALVVTETSFIANWSAVSGATGYRLDVVTTADFQPLSFVVSNQSVAGTSSTVGGLTSGVTYYYRVRASNACGTSDNSNVISAVPSPILAAWDVSGLSNYGSSPQAATVFNDDVTVGGLRRGLGLSAGTSAVRGWGGTGWANLEADAISGNKFATFTVKGDANRNVSFTSISTFDYRLDSATGPTSGKLQYSLDGSTFTDVPDAVFTYDESASGGSVPPIELSGIEELQNVPDDITVTFRIVNYGASSGSEPWYIYDKNDSTANDFEIRGTICVSPTSYALNGGGTFCSPAFTDTQLTLADSEVGVSYQLYTNNGVNAVGSPVEGTGNSISFGFHSEPDAYTVVGTRTAGGCSEVVGSATITILATPGTPTGFSATLNVDEVDLSWNTVAGATGYKVYRRLSTDVGYGAAVATVSGGGTVTYTDSPVGGLSYYYKVSAVNGSCEGDASSEDGPVVVPANCPDGIRPTLSTQGLTALAASVRVNIAPSLDISIIAADSSGCTAPTFAMSGLPRNTQGSSLGITITDTPDSPAAGSSTRRIQWLPESGQVDTYPVTLTATDSQGLTTSITFVIYVGNQSDTVSGGIPSSQTNWNIPIMEVRVPSSGNATVEWQSVDGIIYDVYSSTAPIGGGASWNKIVTGHVAASSSTYTDVVASGSARYYNVVPAGQSANNRGVWGVVRPSVPSSTITYMAPPVPETASDLDFSGNLGDALAEALTDPDDRIYVMSSGASPSFTTLRLVGGEWIIDGGGAYTTPLNPGQGFLIVRDSGSASPTFSGPVGNLGTEQISLAVGYNLIGISEGKGLPAISAFENAVPVGIYDEEQADQVILLNSNGSFRRLWRLGNGTWYDTETEGATSLILQPGQAYYYIRRNSGTTLSF